ncbi:MAG: SDR family NAD(P)-dependent oxidoreductase, partial [Crocinitomicaceae bacterium]|nr:SDR family NAD(P)-dependent oxidoreductase [Crocinitomicaceae bacterium]
MDLSNKDITALISKQTQLEAKDFYVETLLAEPSSDRGERVQLKNGKRFKQSFSKLNVNQMPEPVLKENGVYVIAGGSGSVGRAISKYLISKYNANVVWIGRKSKQDATASGVFEEFQSMSKIPAYYSADVVDISQLKKVMKEIKKEYPVINGGIFSALILSVNESLVSTDEKQFQKVVSLKSLGSFHFYEVLKNENLDFLSYCSSGQAFSFSGAAKLTSYAAGICFSDTLVQHLAQINTSFPIGIVNWGFWKSSMDHDGNELFNDKHIGYLEDSEGSQCFDVFTRLLSHNKLQQLLCFRPSDSVLELMNSSGSIVEVLQASHVVLSSTPELYQGKLKPLKLQTLLDNSPYDDLNGEMLQVLCIQLLKSGILFSKDSGYPLFHFNKSVIDGKHLSLMDELLEMLVIENLIIRTEHGFSIPKLTSHEIMNTWVDEGWKTWNLKKENWLKDSELNAQVVLVECALKKISDVLKGDVLGTDVLFPNSSVEMVEAIYRENKTSRYFNNKLLECITSSVDKLRATRKLV